MVDLLIPVCIIKRERKTNEQENHIQEKDIGGDAQIPPDGERQGKGQHEVESLGDC